MDTVPARVKVEYLSCINHYTGILLVSYCKGKVVGHDTDTMTLPWKWKIKDDIVQIFCETFALFTLGLLFTF